MLAKSQPPTTNGAYDVRRKMLKGISKYNQIAWQQAQIAKSDAKQMQLDISNNMGSQDNNNSHQENNNQTKNSLK